MFPWDVNAVYNSDINTVTIPPAMGTLWNPNLPVDWYLASVGFVIGHEMAHSIDPFGIQFDEMGVYNPVVYPATYLDFLSCLKNDAVASGLYPNQTLGEMFADRVGMETISSHLPAENSKSFLLFDTKAITTSQMAFILFVRTWCQSPQYYRGQKLNTTIETDVHPPNRFRVLETLRGNSNFNSAFGCSQIGCKNVFQ